MTSAILLHGLRHDEVGQPRSLAHWARTVARTDHEGEFASLPLQEARTRVGRGLAGHRWSVIANGGVHLIRNADHVTGEHRTRWVGSLGLNYRLHTEAALP